MPDVGGAWIDDQPGLQITGNRINSKVIFGDVRSHNVTAPPAADYQVSLDLIWAGATSDVTLGVVGRGTGMQFRGDGYMAYYDAARSRWELIKLNGGNAISLGTYPQPYTTGQTHTLTLQMTGSAITMSVDGVARISVTDASVAGINNAGIYAHYNGEQTSIVGDNFSVRALGGGQAPSAPAAPNPTDGATGIGATPILTWIATGATTYDVAFGTTNPPTLVASNQSATSYAPSTLTGNKTYFWRITARNAGGTTAGPTWSFTTKPAPPTALRIIK
jgi:hypothetical protein